VFILSKVLDVGCTSFAGSVFVDAALTAGFYVVGRTPSGEVNVNFLPYKRNALVKNYKFHQLHLVDNLEQIISVIGDSEPEYVVDFAGQGMVAESWDAPELLYETNLVSKVRLHDFLRKCRFLKKYERVSTPEVYGSNAGLIGESCGYNPSTPYAVSHAAVDMSLLAFHRNYGFPVVITRFANFYGPGQQLYRIIPKTILTAISSGVLNLHGGGSSVRAFIYASDIATALLLALQKGEAGEVYHFTTDEFLTIREVVERILWRLDIDFDSCVKITPDRLGKDQAYLMDSSKAKNALGWQPLVSFDEGVNSTISWVREGLTEFMDLPHEYKHKS